MTGKVQPFTVTVTRNGKQNLIHVRGTHEMLDRLCERIDEGTGRWGEWFGPLTQRWSLSIDGEPTWYDDRELAR